MSRIVSHRQLDGSRAIVADIPLDGLRARRAGRQASVSGRQGLIGHRCYRLIWYRRLVSALSLCSLSLSVYPLRANAATEDATRLSARVSELERQATALSVGLALRSPKRTNRAASRLVDAQILHEGGDYSRSAILLLDYVKKYPNTPGYSDALYYLADSLFHQKYFNGARKYFQKIIEARARHPRHYQAALQRMLDISLHLRDYTHVDDYLRAIAEISRPNLEPGLPYVLGKFFYFRKRDEDAIRALTSVGPKNPYYQHAQYFLGAIRVRAGDQKKALKIFEAFSPRKATTPSQQQIHELAHLAVGRLNYAQNNIKAALAAYTRVPATSPFFDLALFESAWSYVKAKEYTQALRSLDLLLLHQPQSPLVPDVTVLRGNLLIRGDKWGEATELFSTTREQFAPSHEQLAKLLIEHREPEKFFNLLLDRGLNEGTLAFAAKMPSTVLAWVKSKAPVKQAIKLVRELELIHKEIKEADDLIRRLEQAINSPAKARIFNEFASAHANSLGAYNRLTTLVRSIASAERALISPSLSAADREHLEKLAKSGADLSLRVDSLPQDRKALSAQAKSQGTKLHRLARELSRLIIVVESLEAQLVAAEKYFHDTQNKRRKKDAPRGDSKAAIQASFRKEISGFHGIIEELQREIKALGTTIASVKDRAGVAGPEEELDSTLRRRQLLSSESQHRFMADRRAAIRDPGLRRQFDSLASLMGRCRKIDERLQSFSREVDRGIEAKLADVRTVIDEEKTAIAKYQNAATQENSDTQAVAGLITYRGFEQVRDRLYEIVVRSDIGIIDVAWALKANKTADLSRLVRQQKLDLKLLDAEFEEVLGPKQ